MSLDRNCFMIALATSARTLPPSAATSARSLRESGLFVWSCSVHVFKSPELPREVCGICYKCSSIATASSALQELQACWRMLVELEYRFDGPVPLQQLLHEV